MLDNTPKSPDYWMTMLIMRPTKESKYKQNKDARDLGIL